MTSISAPRWAVSTETDDRGEVTHRSRDFGQGSVHVTLGRYDDEEGDGDTFVRFHTFRGDGWIDVVSPDELAILVDALRDSTMMMRNER